MKSIEDFKNIFEIEKFRGHQEKIISHAMEGNNSLVLMPTGGGKSLCYQAPIFLQDKLGIIISPLISLMKDQVDGLREKGICAHFLNSSLEYQEKKVVFNDIVSGDCKYLYVAPETALKLSFINFVKTLDLSLIAIDESHCISKWGHQFRPEYQDLGKLTQHFPKTPIMALTATANIETRKDIISSLQIMDAKIFLTSFDRPNIYLEFEKKVNESNQLMTYLAKNFSEGRGIIYCLSRKRVEMFGQFLKGKGYEVKSYHAGMGALKREEIQDWFAEDSGRIVVATVAFGMGIDVSDIRFVCHMDLPKNIESYYQEIGRAGRDGKPSLAKAFYSRRDRALLMNMASSGDNSLYHREIHGVNQLYGIAQSFQCKRKLLLQAFDERYSEVNNRCCDTCDSSREGIDATVMAFELLYLIIKSPRKRSLKDWREFICDKKMFKDLTKKYKNPGHCIEEVIFQLMTLGYLGTCENGNLGALAENFEDDFRLFIRSELETPVITMKKPTTKKVLTREKTIDESDLYPGLAEMDEDTLRDELKDFRSSQAKRRRVPAFKIFTDKTIESIIDVRPTSEDDFFGVFGFGEKKIKKFASSILDIGQH